MARVVPQVQRPSPESLPVALSYARLKAARGLLPVAAAAACGAAAAQGAASIVPTVGLTVTATDNRDLSATRRESDLITQISPGISIASRRGPLQGQLNYALNGVVYARGSELNNVYHSLGASGRWSLLDGRAGVDATASAGRQLISAFGTQSPDANVGTANQAQVVSYSLSPHLNGRLPGNAFYRTRVTFAESRSDAGSTGDSRSLNAVVGVGGQLGALGWGVDYIRALSETPQTARSHNARLFGSLSYLFDPELQGFVRLGSESDDIRTGRSERTTTWGLGVLWQPTPRTTLRADYDNRFFGRSHAFSFSHRTARTVWTASDARNFQAGGASGRAVVSNYDLFFAQFASIEPDPVKRDVLVRNFLAANGLDAGSRVVIGGFLTSGPTVQRSQNLTAAYQGLRHTLTVSLLGSDTRSLGAGGAQGDLANANAVRQQGLSVGFSHRLTPESSLVVTASLQRTPAAGTFGGSDQQSVVATWSTRLGRTASGSLGLRHTRYDNDSNPYNESAVIGSLRLQF
jgi:uncharacterized protein (PEP-CTERM system associated)